MEHISKVLGNFDRGKAIPSQMIKEPEGEKREDLRKSLGVSSLANTFANFRPVKGTKTTLVAFKALAEGKTHWKMLLCYGGVGNGKTHLCEAAVIALDKKGVRCRVITMSRIMQALKAGIEHDKHGNEGRPWMPYAEHLNSLCSRTYLIIDDVGMGGSGSNWEFGQLEEIVVARYRENLFTILTTNLDIKFNPDYPSQSFIPERIVSRFQDPDIGRVVLNEGGDYRRLKAKR